MRLKQILLNKKDENALKAINSHTGFIRLVAAEVEKDGIENVLAYDESNSRYWLRSAYKRLLDFAEECQLKMIALKIEGELDFGENLAAAIRGLYGKRNGNVELPYTDLAAESRIISD